MIGKPLDSVPLLSAIAHKTLSRHAVRIDRIHGR